MDIQYNQLINVPMQKLQKFFGMIAVTSSDQPYDIVLCKVVPYSNAGNDIEESLSYKVRLTPVNEVDLNIYGKGRDYYTSDLKSLVNNPNTQYEIVQ